MAFFQSLKRGQAPAKCNLCEVETKIKWKCINCDVLMCAKCKDKIHVKLKFAKNHTVLDIKQVGLHREAPDFSDLKCESHPDQPCVLFCTTCEILVCTLCITQLHNGHGFVEMSEGYNIKVEKIKNETIKVKEKIKDLTKRKGEMSPVHIEDSAKYKELIKKIEVHEMDLKKTVEKGIKELKGELKTKLSELEKDEISKVEKVVNNLQELSSNAEDLIKSNNAEKVFIEWGKMITAVKIADTGFDSLSFLPGQISPFNVGSLQVVSNAVDIRIVKQFLTELSRVFFILLCPDNSLWISDSERLQKVKPVDHELTVELSFNILVYGMAVTLTGDLLLVTNGSVLKQISGKTGKLTDSIYHVESLLYTALHVTTDGKVIVGVLTPVVKRWPATGRRALIVMNQNGEHETIYEFDKNSIRIFTYPLCITTTDNGKIWVVDKLYEDNRGRIVLLSQGGDVLQTYSGHPNINNENKPFIPVNIVATPSENLIVSELSSDIFHILDKCGHLITNYNAGDKGISDSYSFCFTRTVGQLFIGCSPRSSNKGQIHEVKISGF